VSADKKIFSLLCGQILRLAMPLHFKFRWVRSSFSPPGGNRGGGAWGRDFAKNKREAWAPKKSNFGEPKRVFSGGFLWLVGGGFFSSVYPPGLQRRLRKKGVWGLEGRGGSFSGQGPGIPKFFPKGGSLVFFGWGLGALVLWGFGCLLVGIFSLLLGRYPRFFFLLGARRAQKKGWGASKKKPKKK